MRIRFLRASRVAAFLAAAHLPPAARALDLEVGQVVESEDLPTLSGGREPLLGRGALANVFVFFRPGQEHSLDALRQMAACERDFAGKPVHVVAVVSGSFPAPEVEAAVRETGIRAPVLVDRGDALYARLGVRLHPVIGVADGRRRLVAWHPYQRLGYCEGVKARVRFLLGEISEADLAAALSPPPGGLPGADAASVARRDVNLGRRQLAQGLPDKARASALRALERDPGLAAAHALLGEAEAARGSCADAAKAFDRALAIDPADQAALAGRRACARR